LGGGNCKHIRKTRRRRKRKGRESESQTIRTRAVLSGLGFAQKNLDFIRGKRPVRNSEKALLDKDRKFSR